MSQKTSYYIVSPNGREKLPDCDNVSEAEALIAFQKHWTAKAKFFCKGKRILVKEVKTEIHIEDVHFRS